MSPRLQQLVMTVRKLQVEIADTEQRLAHMKAIGPGGGLPGERHERHRQMVQLQLRLNKLQREYERAQQELRMTAGGLNPIAPVQPADEERAPDAPPQSVIARTHEVRPLADSLSLPRRLACAA